jgi:hypothetical protein
LLTADKEVFSSENATEIEDEGNLIIRDSEPAKLGNLSGQVRTDTSSVRTSTGTISVGDSVMDSPKRSIASSSLELIPTTCA